MGETTKAPATLEASEGMSEPLKEAAVYKSNPRNTEKQVRKPNKLSSQNRIDIIERYKSGENSGDLSREYGVSDTAILQLLRTRGVDRRPPSVYRRTHTINHHAFDVLTPEALYWLGFLFADGCVHDSYVIVCTSNKDRDHVEKLKRFLGSSHMIQTVKPSKRHGHGNTGEMARLSIRSEYMAARLVSLGMVNQKKADRIAPPELAVSSDFWRGCIDGDGTVSVQGNGRPYIALCGNRTIIEQYIGFVKAHVPNSRINPVTHINIFTAMIVNRAAATIARVLYENNRVALDRKKANAMTILNMSLPEKKPPSMRPDAVYMRAYRAKKGRSS